MSLPKRRLSSGSVQDFAFDWSSRISSQDVDLHAELGAFFQQHYKALVNTCINENSKIWHAQHAIVQG